MRCVYYDFRGSQGSFCRYDSCVITDQLATDAGALERELLLIKLADPWQDDEGLQQVAQALSRAA
jgi:hypothetical protein